MKLRNNYYLRNKDTGYVISFTTRKEQMIFYNELNGWEVVDIVTKSNEGATAEPLIKDEKIRKAVRAWAEVNSIEKALYAERPNRSLCLLTDAGEDDYNIDFVGWIPTLTDGEVYTIAELCGEDEE